MHDNERNERNEFNDAIKQLKDKLDEMFNPDYEGEDKSSAGAADSGFMGRSNMSPIELMRYYQAGKGMIDHISNDDAMATDALNTASALEDHFLQMAKDLDRLGGPIHNTAWMFVVLSLFVAMICRTTAIAGDDDEDMTFRDQLAIFQAIMGGMYSRISLLDDFGEDKNDEGEQAD